MFGRNVICMLAILIMAPAARLTSTAQTPKPGVVSERVVIPLNSGSERETRDTYNNGFEVAHHYASPVGEYRKCDPTTIRG